MSKSNYVRLPGPERLTRELWSATPMPMPGAEMVHSMHADTAHRCFEVIVDVDRSHDAVTIDINEIHDAGEHGDEHGPVSDETFILLGGKAISVRPEDPPMHLHLDDAEQTMAIYVDGKVVTLPLNEGHQKTDICVEKKEEEHEHFHPPHEEHPPHVPHEEHRPHSHQHVETDEERLHLHPHPHKHEEHVHFHRHEHEDGHDDEHAGHKRENAHGDNKNGNGERNENGGHRNGDRLHTPEFNDTDQAPPELRRELQERRGMLASEDVPAEERLVVLDESHATVEQLGALGILGAAMAYPPRKRTSDDPSA